ncbi:hypothetical protein [Amycolatopsis sp. cmx-4-54]|uniref:hypothetical protein n=1 Tax=Amycolatopsis sp. cmx-4-54 TaxID=2790936 RepID=UPI00397C3FDD
MLKKIGIVAATIAAGALLGGGVASADTPAGHNHGSDHSGQVGLLNLNNLDVLHNVNATLGLCDNAVNVLGVQVPVNNSLNGIGIPILSPGQHQASGQSPQNCAAGGIVSGGSIQDN